MLIHILSDTNRRMNTKITMVLATIAVISAVGILATTSSVPSALAAAGGINGHCVGNPHESELGSGPGFTSGNPHGEGSGIGSGNPHDSLGEDCP